MNTFTEFYFIESAQPLKIDWVKGVYKGTEINKGLYDYAKTFLKKPMFKANDKVFQTKQYIYGDPNTSEIYDKGMLKHSWKTIKEIVKYTMNYGEIYLITVSNGSNDFYYVGNDKKFTDNSKTTIYRILDYLKPKQQKLVQRRQEKSVAKDSAEQSQAEEKVKTKAENEALSKKIATTLGLEEISLFKFKDKMLDVTFDAKTELEARQKIKEATSKLPDTDPRHGRYGYFDIDNDDYEMLTGPKGKFMTNDNWKIKNELSWHTDTRTESSNEFGEGLYYTIKSSSKGHTEGKTGLVYLFKYYDNYLPNTAIMIFDGIDALRIFDELRILKTDDIIGKDKKDHLRYSKQLRWVNERPQDIAPPDTAKTIVKKAEIKNKTEVSTKTRYIAPVK